MGNTMHVICYGTTHTQKADITSHPDISCVKLPGIYFPLLHFQSICHVHLQLKTSPTAFRQLVSLMYYTIIDWRTPNVSAEVVKTRFVCTILQIVCS